MVNEIPTLLANHGRQETDLWYIDPRFVGVTVPASIRKIHSLIVGQDVDNAVMQLMSILNAVDIQQYKYVFDSRVLFDNISDTSIYDLYKNHTDDNTIEKILSIPGLNVLFTGDKYTQKLSELYSASRESVVRVCAVILALAYKLKQVFISGGGF